MIEYRIRFAGLHITVGRHVSALGCGRCRRIPSTRFQKHDRQERTIRRKLRRRLHPTQSIIQGLAVRHKRALASL